MRFENTAVMNFEGALRGMRNPMNSWAKSDSIFWIGCDHEWNENADEVARAWADYETKDMPEGEEKEQCWDEVYEKRRDWLYENGSTYLTADHHSTQDFIGPKDMDLCRRLINGGSEHRKFLRQIMVSVDITAPLYWWKEFDTYKVGTTANSTSTMHKLASTPITLECFETDDYCGDLVYFTHDGDTLTDYTVNDIMQNIVEDLEALRQKYNETRDKRYWKELIRLLPNGWLQTRTVTMNYENLRGIHHQRKGHKLSEWHSFCEWVKELPYAEELIIN